jgi:hypothetical protein
VIDWLRLLAHTGWILGAALLLALVSREAYDVETTGGRLRSLFARLNERPASWIALLLIGAGLAGTSRSILEVIFWALFALASAAFAWQLWRRQPRPLRSNSTHGTHGN